MTTIAIGIDLGHRKSHACVLDDVGAVFWRGEFPSTREGNGAFLRGFSHARVVIKVGGHSR